MTDEELTDLLIHLRAQVVQSGHADIDARILDSQIGEVLPPKERLVRYLRAVQDELLLESDRVSSDVLGRLQSVARQVDGDPITGVELRMTPEDAALYGVRSMDLVGSRQAGDLSDALGALLQELEASDEL